MIRLQRPSAPKIGLLEIYGAIGVFAMLVARFVPLARWVPGWRCAFRHYLGIPCLTCGMTRAFDWFVRGRILDSLAVNPVGFVLACLSVVGVLYLAAAPWRPPKIAFDLSPQAARLVRVWAVVLVIGNWGYLIVRSLVVGG